MNPELMKAGDQRLAAYQEKLSVSQVVNTESGGNVSHGRPHKAGELDLVHGRILYLEDVSVSFDGFKAINKLSLDVAPGELHHRAERRWQDHDDGHHHRQDTAR